MNMPRYTGYTSLICNIKIYFIQRESQRVNIFSSINKMTALLVFGPIKNSVSVKHCPKTQLIWAFNIILNFLANTPFTFGHKKDCLYGIIPVWLPLFAVQRNAKTMGYTKLCNEPQRSTTSHNESMTHNNHPGNRLV